MTDIRVSVPTAVIRLIHTAVGRRTSSSYLTANAMGSLRELKVLLRRISPPIRTGVVFSWEYAE